MNYQYSSTIEKYETKRIICKTQRIITLDFIHALCIDYAYFCVSFLIRLVIVSHSFCWASVTRCRKYREWCIVVERQFFRILFLSHVMWAKEGWAIWMENSAFTPLNLSFPSCVHLSFLNCAFYYMWHTCNTAWSPCLEAVSVFAALLVAS